MEKITGNELMTPAVKPGFSYGDGSYEEPSIKGGITIRQHFAAMAMQGLCANSIPGQHQSFPILAQDAVIYADALIDALNKPIK